MYDIIEQQILEMLLKFFAEIPDEIKVELEFPI